jgi:rubrerythrin
MGTARPPLEVADIFRRHGPAWRQTERLSLGQLKVMSAIEQCRSAALGGHALRCDGCGYAEIAYNSCRNRHCPKCQAKAAKRWLEARQADLLPVEYYHVVFTLPAPIAAIALYNKAVVYGLLFDIAAETMRTIAIDPKHLGAQIGMTMVLHTWGSALTHHPHVHGIVPGGGLSPDGERWVACKHGFFLPVRVLSRLFRRRFLEALEQAHGAGRLQFFGEYAALAQRRAFNDWLAPLRKCEWVVYAKRPFAGPQAVLAYLSRYTHRVAISNQRLIALDERGVTFRWKDYRAKGQTPVKTMTLSAAEFMRRFLLHVLPGGFHRIRHYGLLANAGRREHLAHVRQLLEVPVEASPPEDRSTEASQLTFICPHCGAGMIITRTFPRHSSIRAPPALRVAI